MASDRQLSWLTQTCGRWTDAWFSASATPPKTPSTGRHRRQTEEDPCGSAMGASASGRKENSQVVAWLLISHEAERHDGRIRSTISSGTLVQLYPLISYMISLYFSCTWSHRSSWSNVAYELMIWNSRSKFTGMTRIMKIIVKSYVVIHTGMHELWILVWIQAVEFTITKSYMN